MTWYRKVGFYNNPFSIKPAAFSDKLIGYEDLIKEVSYNILSGKTQFILGNYGEGKTALLKRIINDFGGKKELIYFSCNRLDRVLDVDKLLKGKYGMLGNLFNIRAKNMILLLDEAQCLTEEDYSQIVKYRKEGYLRAIVLAGASFDKQKFNPEPVLINIKRLTPEDAVNIVRKRIGNLQLISDEAIKFIALHSNYNTRELLKNCEEVCRHVVENSKKEATKELAIEALGLNQERAAPKEEERKMEAAKSAEPKIPQTILARALEVKQAVIPKKEAQETVKNDIKKLPFSHPEKKVIASARDNATNNTEQQPSNKIAEELYY